MKRKLGNTLMILGAVLLLGALSLFLYNRNEQSDAAQAVEQVMPQIHIAIDEVLAETSRGDASEPLIPPETQPPEPRMTEVEIDGYGYIGYLSLPTLGMELPIMSEWDYVRLKIAPCRYTGTTMGDNLVLAGHNYIRHFGPIRRLKVGDSVFFTDMDGVTTAYEVAALDVLVPTAIEEMTSSGFDLTLFTCTYGGKSRMTVYCSRV